MKTYLLTPSSVSIRLGLLAGMSVADAIIQTKIYGSGMVALIMSNKEMEDIMNIVKSTEESGLLKKGIHETIIYEVKVRKGRQCY